ncbi:permease-like cell division protein FtsX [Streptococcus tangpeifui]|uniref:permease-like cell division protein FtsX n=1 Tax=Streptococcus tangpeifui TaxID=2709400 RepID=UPI0013E9DBD1|nr:MULTISPECIES: permease-like cell division protein FtsX [unclassified Streptococcus]
MIRNFFRHIKESFVSLKRQGWMTFAAVSSVTITLTLVGIFLAVLLNINKLGTDVENNLTINVYMETNVFDDSPNKADGSVNENYHAIYNKIQEINGVKSIKFSSKNDQLADLQKQYGDAWSYDEGSNPLFDAYLVKVKSAKDMKSISKQIKEIEGVNDANYGGVDTDRLTAVVGKIRTWGLAGTVLLVLVAIFLISNTIRITIMSRKDDIIIMRLVGAKNSYIRTPFFFEGAWVGILGAILPALIVYYLYTITYNRINPSMAAENLGLYPANPYLYYLIGGLFLIGIVIGSIGSMISIRRYLKA